MWARLWRTSATLRAGCVPEGILRDTWRVPNLSWAPPLRTSSMEADMCAWWRLHHALGPRHLHRALARRLMSPPCTRWLAGGSVRAPTWKAEVPAGRSVVVRCRRERPRSSGTPGFVARRRPEGWQVCPRRGLRNQQRGGPTFPRSVSGSAQAPSRGVSEAAACPLRTLFRRGSKVNSLVLRSWLQVKVDGRGQRQAQR